MLALGSPTSVRTSTTCGALLRELEVSSLVLFQVGFLTIFKSLVLGREKLFSFSIFLLMMGFYRHFMFQYSFLKNALIVLLNLSYAHIFVF